MSSAPNASPNREPGVPLIVWRAIAVVWLVVLVFALLKGSILIALIALLMTFVFGMQAFGKGPFKTQGRRHAKDD